MLSVRSRAFTVVVSFIFHLANSDEKEPTTAEPEWSTVQAFDNVSVATNYTTTDRSMLSEQTAVTSAPALFKTGILTAADYQRLRDVQGWLYLALDPLALVLLVLSAIVFLRDSHIFSSVYLAVICLAESWYIAVMISHYACKLSKKCFTSQRYVEVSIWSVSYTGMAARRCALVLNGLLTFQRFVAVAFPLKVGMLRFLGKPRYSVIFSVILTFLLHLYRPLRYTAVAIDGADNTGDESWTQGFSSLFIQNKRAFLVMEELSKYICSYIPMLACLVFNCLLVSALAKHKKLLSSLNLSQITETFRSKTERQTTVTILASSFIMLIFNSMVSINEGVSSFSSNYGILKQEHYLYMVLRSCFVILLHVSDILMVLSYIFLSSKFRCHFVALISPSRRCPCRQTHSLPTTTVSASAVLAPSVTKSHSGEDGNCVDRDSVFKY